MEVIACEERGFRVALCRLANSTAVRKTISEVTANRLPRVSTGVFDTAEEVEKLASADLAVIKIDAAQPLTNDLQMISTLTCKENAPHVVAIIKNSTLTAKIKLYQAGAQDCIDFPAERRRFEEVLSTAVTRACGIAETPTLDTDRLLISSSRGIAHLSYFESALLFRLSQLPGRVMCREDIASLLGKNNAAYDERALEKFVSRLRSKIKESLDMDLVLSVRGYGYRLAAALSLASEELTDWRRDDNAANRAEYGMQ